MAKRRRKPSVPIMLFWSKRDQLRFIESVEKLVSTCNDLSMLRTLFEECVSRIVQGQRTPKRRARSAPTRNGKAVAE